MFAAPKSTVVTVRPQDSLSEAVQIRLRRSESWLRKSRSARNLDSDKPPDLDAQFVFLWIAFNALYGQRRYEVDGKEIVDFTRFLERVETLSRGAVATALRQPDVEKHVEHLLQSPFLNIDCWREWDRAGIRDRQQRVQTARHTYDKEHPTVPVFQQLYTLRNQMLHGAATDGGRRNRESLKNAIPVLEISVRTLIGLVKEHHAQLPALEALPYPPSIGESAPFNGLRFRK